MRFTCQVLKHLVKEWQRKVVFHGRLIEPPIIDANSQAILHPGWDQPVRFIFNNCKACLLRNQMDETDPLIV